MAPSKKKRIDQLVEAQVAWQTDPLPDACSKDENNKQAAYRRACRSMLSPSCDDARPHLDMAPSGSPQPPNLLGGLKDLPNPGLIGYFLQVLERIYNEALAEKTQNVEDVDHSPPNAVSWTVQLTALS